MAIQANAKATYGKYKYTAYTTNNYTMTETTENPIQHLKLEYAMYLY